VRAKSIGGLKSGFRSALVTRRAALWTSTHELGDRRLSLRSQFATLKTRAREGSDIDLLVDFNPGRSLLDHAQLVEELRALLGVSVDVVSSRGLKPNSANRSQMTKSRK
jgi:hypothetical protein